MNLVNAELLKIRSTATWWIFGLIMLPLWALSLLVNWGTSSIGDGVDTTGLDPGAAARIDAAQDVLNVAAKLYTSGQFFGVLIVMILGAIVVTNEYFHQTATTTFLVTPRRERVIVAKLAAAALLGLAFWLVMTVLNLVITPFILDDLGATAQLGAGAVWQAIALNALAFVLWAMLGVGFGVLIRSQIAATVTLAVVYLVGTFGSELIFGLLAAKVSEFFLKLQVIVPTTASQLMISGTELPGNPPRWVGALVLIAYAAGAGVLGTAIMKKRDIA